ncbi:NAD-dependent deacetylase [Thermodesulfobacteriota bacterium]
MMDQKIAKGADLIREADSILAFVGAGISTESGIPDFRSPGGLWEKYDPSEFYFQRFISDEIARKKYWHMSTEVYKVFSDASPNRAHFILAELESMGKLLAIVTQNVDGLHQRAGNSPEKIIEIHGTALSVSCLSCGKKYPRDEIHERVESGTKVPYCDDCAGMLKPDTISFGQAMPEDKMKTSFRLAEACDLCIVLGSSLVVYPAASVPVKAVEAGAKLMIINRDETPMDKIAHLVIHDSLGKTLSRIMELVSQS